MSATTRTAYIIGRISLALGAVALLAIGALITASVALRFAGGVIKGGTEITEMLVIIMASMSLLAATVYGAHPHVHMLVDRLRPLAKRRVAIFTAALAAGFWAVATFVTGRVTFENWQVVEETELLQLSVIPYRIIWTLALALLTVILVIRAWQPDDPEAGADAGH